MTINQKKSFIAFYLSKFNEQAYKQLGYSGSWSEAMDDISKRIAGFDVIPNSYIRRRRDEFDVFFENGRAGYRNRKPTVQVMEMFGQWNGMEFEEMTELVKTVLSGDFEKEDKIELSKVGEELTEHELEAYLNFQDDSASLNTKMKEIQQRIYSRRKIEMLKRLYAYRCQICGKNIGSEHDTYIAEAHHIKYFSSCIDNSSDNLLILCPNHHTLIHKLNPVFDYDQLEYVYSDGKRDGLILDFHLTHGKEDK